MGARNQVGIGLSYRLPARQATQTGGIGSLESILGLLKSLKIRAQYISTVAGVLDELYSQLIPLSGVAVQARQST
jgi:hypothetical protein